MFKAWKCAEINIITVSHAHTLRVGLANRDKVIGVWRIAKFFILPMQRSTWIRSHAIFCPSNASLGWNWPFPSKKGGMLRPTPICFRSSSIKNHDQLSPRNLAHPLSNCSKPDFWVSSLSEMLPMNRLEMNDTAPLGVHAMRNLAVLWCLYDDPVELCRWRSVGVSMYISKASTMQIVVGYFSLNIVGRCCNTVSSLGHHASFAR